MYVLLIIAYFINCRRNDFISHVREAATVALQQIGGDEAANAIHMTKVLSDEIRSLTQEWYAFTTHLSANITFPTPYFIWNIWRILQGFAHGERAYSDEIRSLIQE